MLAPIAAIVLAGGGSRRLGGADKCWLDVGGKPILESVVAAVAGAGAAASSGPDAGDAAMGSSAGSVEAGRIVSTVSGPIVVVGPRRELITPVRWTREEPPGAGPVAGLQAGLACLDQWRAANAHAGAAGDAPRDAGSQTTPAAGSGRDVRAALERCLVLGGDMPFVGVGLAELLRDSVNDHSDVVIAQDSTGHDQYLLAVWRTSSLRAALASAAANASLRSLYRDVEVTRRNLPAVAMLDCDTPAQLAWAREFGLIQPEQG